MAPKTQRRRQRAGASPSIGQEAADQRQRGRYRRGGADALDGSCRDQDGERGRERRGQRAGGEGGHADDEEAAAAVEVAEPAAEQQGAAEREPERGQHPLGVERVGAEVVAQGGQRDRHRQAVDADQELSRAGDDGAETHPSGLPGRRAPYVG
jgi:hypothetical protein